MSIGRCRGVVPLLTRLDGGGWKVRCNRCGSEAVGTDPAVARHAFRHIPEPSFTKDQEDFLAALDQELTQERGNYHG